MVDFTGGTWRSLIDGLEVIAIPDSDLLYRIDEGSGTTLNDDRALVDATISGADWVDDAGVFAGWKLDFNDGDEFDAENSPFNTGQDEVSFAVWLEPAQDTEMTLFGLAEDSTEINDAGDGVLVSWRDEGIAADVQADGGYFSDAQVSTPDTDTLRRYFISVSATDNGDVDVYLWDETGFIGEGTHNSTSELGDFTDIRPRGGGFAGSIWQGFAGTMDMMLMDKSTHEKEYFEDVWESTKP